MSSAVDPTTHDLHGHTMIKNKIINREILKSHVYASPSVSGIRIFTSRLKGSLDFRPAGSKVLDGGLAVELVLAAAP